MKLFKILITALAALMLITAVSCGKAPLELTDEEARELLARLVPKAEEINEIFFGEGLPAVDEAYENEPVATAYYPVHPDFGYKSIAEIKAAAEAVYSKRYLEGIYVTAFRGVTSESSDGVIDTSVSPRYKEISGELRVDVFADKNELRTKPDVSTAKVVEKTSEYVKVSMNYTSGESSGTMTVLLTVQEGVWLLDSPTY